MVQFELQKREYASTVYKEHSDLSYVAALEELRAKNVCIFTAGLTPVAPEMVQFELKNT